MCTNPADANAAKPPAGAANICILGFVSKLGDADDDDRVDAKKLANLCGGSWIGSDAIGKILFGKDFIHGLALNHGIGAVFHQILDEEIRDAFAHVDIRTKNRPHVGMYGAIITITYSQPLL